MNVIRRGLALVRESVASAFSQPAMSLITAAVVASACLAVLLTTGRTVGAENAVLATLDSAGTRSIIVRAAPDAGLGPDVLDRLERIEGIAWAGAFGPARDVRNSVLGDGARVPMRIAWGEDLARIGLPATPPPVADSAWASRIAIEQLGLADSIGGVRGVDGASAAIVGQIETPEFLRFLEPLVLMPHHQVTESDRVSVLVIIAERPELIGSVTDLALSMLALDDPSKASVVTNEELAELRAVIEGQLEDSGRGLVLIILAATAVIVAVLLYGSVLLRRKDFGRRRALGASRGLIVTLVLVQTALVSSIGAALGSAGAAIVLIAGRDPLPSPAFFVAIGVLACGTALIAALIPAIVASHRDPLRELRVP